MSDHETPTPLRSRRLRLLYLAFGWGCFGVGVIGALLPLLPTTPFMLMALWAFSRSSQRVHDWLYNHRIFGPRLQNWDTDRVVPWPIKLTAYISMLGSLSYTAFIGDFHWAIPISTALLILVGIYFISRCPSKPPD